MVKNVIEILCHNVVDRIFFVHWALEFYNIPGYSLLLMKILCNMSIDLMC